MCNAKYSGCKIDRNKSDAFSDIHAYFDASYYYRHKKALEWEDNIRMDLKEIGIDMRNWVDAAQDRDYWRPLENAE